MHYDGLVQDCSNSSALSMELLQSCTKISINLRLKQFDHYFVDHIFKCIFKKENHCISIYISVTFVTEGAIDKDSTFIQIMAQH